MEQETKGYAKSRKIELKDVKISKLYDEKDELVKELQGVADQMQELEKQGNKVSVKLQKVKDKMIPLVEKEALHEINVPIEILASVTKEDGKVFAEVVDQLAEHEVTLKDKYDKEQEIRKQLADSKLVDKKEDK